MMTPQEINTIMATEIMGWKLDKTQYLTKEKHKGGRKLFHHFIMFKNEWNPYEKIDQAFMCLHKWLEGHPDRGYELMDVYWTDKNNNETVMLLYGENKHYHDHKRRGSEAHAICNCLLKAIEKDNN
jgi:hypothetical protein